MDSKEATAEFVRLLRVGSGALSNVLDRDEAKTFEVKTELDEIRFLLDSLDEVGERLTAKIRRAGRAS